MDCSLPAFSISGIFQARILEWVPFPSPGESSQPRNWIQVSCIAGRPFTLWAVYVCIKRVYNHFQTCYKLCVHVRTQSFPCWVVPRIGSVWAAFQSSLTQYLVSGRPRCPSYPRLPWNCWGVSVEVYVPHHDISPPRAGAIPLFISVSPEVCNTRHVPVKLGKCPLDQTGLWAEAGKRGELGPPWVWAIRQSQWSFFNYFY